MDIIPKIIQFLAAFSGCLMALMSIMLYVRLRWPAPALWFLKLYVSALSTVLLLISILIFLIGLITSSVFITLLGIYNVFVFFIHNSRVTLPPSDSSNGFEDASDRNWEDSINLLKKKYFLPARTIIKLPDVPNPRMEQNISFASIPGIDRQLLCDVWQPHESVVPSGLALIYLHGSAWFLLDKDVGTRPLFRHLTAQGHVVMDVAYRLAPETDLMGMVHDIKRAITWMKDNALTFGVNPNHIVVSGGSAGAHLALLAAYTADNSQFTPKDLEGKDISVRAVISFYGPTDLEPMYYHTNQHHTTRSIPGKPKKAVPTQMPAWIVKKMGNNYHRLGFDKGFENAGTFASLIGGHPDECPERYALFSPVTHVHSNCPPTLLIHGEHDLMVPVKTIRLLHTRLVEKHVPTLMHILPQTDHGFDLVLPNISPSAHTAIYDVERFLALQAITLEKPNTVVEKQEKYPLIHS